MMAAVRSNGTLPVRVGRSPASEYATLGGTDLEGAVMLVADVKCYHCGFISGEVVSEDSQAPRLESFRPASGQPGLERGRRPRCVRCGGPVYLDDLRRVRPQRIFDINDKPKRGRPRRSAVLAEAS